MQYLFWIFNYFDQRPIESVKVDYDDASFTTFNAVVRIFQFVLLFFSYFLIAKLIQFIGALFFQISQEKLLMSYYVIPIFFFMEVGLSKLNSAKLLNFSMFIFRATLKYFVIYAIDSLTALII